LFPGTVRERQRWMAFFSEREDRLPCFGIRLAHWLVHSLRGGCGFPFPVVTDFHTLWPPWGEHSHTLCSVCSADTSGLWSRCRCCQTPVTETQSHRAGGCTHFCRGLPAESLLAGFLWASGACRDLLDYCRAACGPVASECDGGGSPLCCLAPRSVSQPRSMPLPALLPGLAQPPFLGGLRWRDAAVPRIWGGARWRCLRG
jgi:hypothetical protein